MIAMTSSLISHRLHLSVSKAFKSQEHALKGSQDRLVNDGIEGHSKNVSSGVASAILSRSFL